MCVCVCARVFARACVFIGHRAEPLCGSFRCLVGPRLGLQFLSKAVDLARFTGVFEVFFGFVYLASEHKANIFNCRIYRKDIFLPSSRSAIFQQNINKQNWYCLICSDTHNDVVDWLQFQ